MGEGVRERDGAGVGLRAKVRYGRGGDYGSAFGSSRSGGWAALEKVRICGGKGEMDRRVLEEVLGGRATQEAQRVRQKSLVKRNFVV